MAQGALDYFSYGPLSGGSPKQIVMILHGLGSDGEDLLWLAAAYASILPDALFILPNAPFPSEPGSGYQWYTPQEDGPLMQDVSIAPSYRALDQFISDQLDHYGLDGAKDLALVGFSQGAAMSIYAGVRRPSAAVISFSGLLIGAVPKPLPKGVGPVFLLHGDADQIIPVYYYLATAKALKEAGVEVASRLHPGMDHMIHKDGLLASSLFLKRAFERGR